MKNWHEQERFWVELSPLFFTEESWTSAINEVDAIERLLRLSTKDRVLDLGCGPGRHAINFAKKGYNVTGIDTTKVFIEEAKKRAEKEKLNINFIIEDMRNFVDKESYDVVVNLFTTFGYFEKIEDDIKVLDNVYASLKPGGRLLIEMEGKEVIAHIFQKKDWVEENGIYLLQKRKLTDNMSMMESRWILIKENSKHIFDITQRLYSAFEIYSMIKDRGFKDVDIYGGLSFEPYDIYARKLVVVAVK